MEDKGTLTTDAAVRMLQAFVLDMGVHEQGASQVVLSFELTNPTPLPVTWSLTR